MHLTDRKHDGLQELIISPVHIWQRDVLTFLRILLRNDGQSDLLGFQAIDQNLQCAPFLRIGKTEYFLRLNEVFVVTHSKTSRRVQIRVRGRRRIRRIALDESPKLILVRRL